MSNEWIKIRGAKENNLKNIDIDIPKNKLVTITGVSGSGKSSLAFDTIYEEGKRRYMESLSSYARMFLGGNKKPDVLSIEGLCPTISIDQKTTSHNPRSTVGTITEIYDYLRVLYARIGTPYCPNGHGVIENLTTKGIIDKIMQEIKEGDKLILMAPVVAKAKGTFADEIETITRNGFVRVRIDGNIYMLDEKIELEKNKFHTIDIIVDRIVFHDDYETKVRIANSVETCLKYGSEKIIYVVNEKEEKTLSKIHSCKVCGFSIPEIEPRLFSFNSPIGACPHCKGLGFTYEPDVNKIITDWELSINDGAIDFFKNTVNTSNLEWLNFNALLKYYKISATKPLSTFTEKELSIILNGSEEPIEYKVKSASGNIFNKFEYIEGVAALIKRRHLETTSEAAREYYSKYMGEITCKHCHGKKLSNIALSIKIDKKDIIDFTELPIDEAIDFLLKLKLDTVKEEIGRMAIKEIVNRLDFLKNVGLGYLTLSRNANTLSGGEAQRIRLGTQIGSSLSGVLYVLDEPSIGLHQKDNEKIIDALKKLRDAGNSILVVEHDLETIEASDYVVEIGPDAGSRGGYVTAYGTPSQIKANKNSITGKYLSNELSIPIPTSRRSGNGSVIEIKGAECNNIKNLSCVIPLGKFVCVTGVSGSGKSTLVNEIITKNILKRTSSPFVDAPKLQSIKGTKEINKVIVVSQEPIGRSPRSNPATYIGVFDDIRDLFATTNEAKARGYSKGRFSFNIPGGRCEKCQGDGVIKVKMFFLPDVYVKCDECQGKRYNDETLSILYKGKNIHDVLEMTVDVAYEFFKNVPNIEQKLKLLQQVGLGYIKLGAPSTELSGGESQRIKLAKFLQRKTNRNSILFLDEPTTGLHIHDIKKIIEVLNKIVDSGATVVVIEHNLDLIKCADYIIDMGPESGISGGKIIATGTPEQVAKKSDISYTGEYLKKLGI